MLKAKITRVLADILNIEDDGFELSVPERPEFGHYSTSLALQLGTEEGKNPRVIAETLADEITAKAPAGFFEKVCVAGPGFVNVWLSPDIIWKEAESVVGSGASVTATMAGKTVMVEFTDPNPFKLLHIGHFMSNAIGESLSRLYEAVGAKVLRVNYQGDVGMHVAMSIWGMQHMEKEFPSDKASEKERMEYLGQAYALGATAYKDGEENKKEEIKDLNKHIYTRDDASVNQMYDTGKELSLAYFESAYRRWGTKFDDYFFESGIAQSGIALVRAHPEIFEESEGAVIFRGEKYGLHTRVFINSAGLPTYEAKELGLNKTKFEKYSPDVSLIVTGNEIREYFQVLMKAMELTISEVAERTRHIGHGMLRLPEGKMSSRTGKVVTADLLLERVAKRLADLRDEGQKDPRSLDDIAIGAVKYSILKQRPGQDIVFDMDKSLSLHGDSGPYLQYTYARLRSVLRKAEEEDNTAVPGDLSDLRSDEEIACGIKIAQFPDVIEESVEMLSPNRLATYLYELSNLLNRFYETRPVIKESDPSVRAARLDLVRISSEVLKRGISLLGMRVLERM